MTQAIDVVSRPCGKFVEVILLQRGTEEPLLSVRGVLWRDPRVKEAILEAVRAWLERRIRERGGSPQGAQDLGPSRN